MEQDPKKLEFDEETCASFIITDQDKVIDTIMEFSDSTKRYIFDTIDKESKKDIICELYDKNDRKFLKPGWDGIIYKFSELKKAVIVYTNERIAFIHFLHAHAHEDLGMNQELINISLKSFMTEQDFTFLKDRGLTEVIKQLKSLT